MANLYRAFREGQEGRRAQDEANYIAQRRKVQDPLADAQAARVAAAQAALVDEYGVKAGDPTSYGQVEGIEQRRAAAPVELEANQLALQAAKSERAKAAALSGLAAFNSVPPEQREAFVAGQGRGLMAAVADATGLDRETVGLALATDPQAAELFTRQLSTPLSEKEKQEAELAAARLARDEQNLQLDRRRVAQGDLRLDIDRQAALAAARATGKEAGRIAAEDLPISERQRQKVRAELDVIEVVSGEQEALLDDLIERAGPATVGVASLTSALPGTPAADYAEDLMTVKSGAGFAQLQRMRLSSPTGAALGAVSDIENQLLQAVDAALSPGQSEAQIKKNLAKYKRLYKTYRDQTIRNYEADMARGGNRTQAPASDAPVEQTVTKVDRNGNVVTE